MEDSTDDLFEHAPCGLLLTTAEDLITRVNATFLVWTGFQRQDLVGRAFHSLLDSDSQALYASDYETRLRESGDVTEAAFQLERADETLMPILVNATAVLSATGDREGVRLAVFDSTVRHDYELHMLEARQRSEKSEASLRILQHASSRFLAAKDELELAAALVSTGLQGLDASDSAVMLNDGGGLRSVQGGHLDLLLTALREEMPDPAGAVFRSAVSTVATLDDAYRLSTSTADLLRECDFEAFSAVPILDGETVLGVFLCFFATPRSFDQHTIDLHSALARQAGLVLSRVQLQTTLERQAMHDPLTGLANRNLLDERISHGLAMSHRSHEPIAVVFVDLDGFKRVNDDLGHRVGDAVLQTVARRMAGAVRDIDLVGRFGGDEFLVVCENTDGAAAVLVTDRLCAEIRQPIAGLPETYAVTASVGIAVYSPDYSPEESSDSLILRADAAMYAAKRSGGDRATLAAPRALPALDQPA